MTQERLLEDHLGFKSTWEEVVSSEARAVPCDTSRPFPGHSIVSWRALASLMMSPVLWLHQLPLSVVFTQYFYGSPIDILVGKNDVAGSLG